MRFDELIELNVRMELIFDQNLYQKRSPPRVDDYFIPSLGVHNKIMALHLDIGLDDHETGWLLSKYIDVREKGMKFSDAIRMIRIVEKANLQSWELKITKGIFAKLKDLDINLDLERSEKALLRKIGTKVGV